mmetsp:Transcript_72393/g.235126  ORF Transcript_72393/g.235126 Transcript_72393/m.235126 type:complete len:215 (+) Transcript_72393:100-744(+)
MSPSECGLRPRALRRCRLQMRYTRTSCQTHFVPNPSPNVLKKSAQSKCLGHLLVGLSPAFLPIGHLRDSVFGRVPALPALPAVGPIASILTAVGPLEDPEAVLLVCDVPAAVHAATWPLVLADAMNHRLLPLSPEAPPVACIVHAKSVDHVVTPLALVPRAVDPKVAAVAVLLAVLEHALKASTFDPSLDAKAILKVVAPLALVRRAALVVVDA